MRSLDFIKKVKECGMQVFTSADAIKILDKDAKYTSLYLSRLAKRKEILKIEKGKYCAADTDAYAAASNILYPSYISMLAAFKYYAITSQNIANIDVVSTKRHKTIKDFDGYSIQFIKIRKTGLFGFYREAQNGTFVAYVEKALIDSALHGLPKLYIIEAVSNAAKAKILNRARFESFASRTNSDGDLEWLDRAVKDTTKRQGVLHDANGV